MKLFLETCVVFSWIGFAARNNLHDTWDLDWRTPRAHVEVEMDCPFITTDGGMALFK
jgi:hypothetical protein